MNTLVHEEKYRGANLLKRISDSKIVLCGAGAVGSNIAENMARQGFKNLTAIDFDRVDDHNRHTQLWGRRDVGQLKVAILKNILFNSMGITVEAISSKLESSNINKYLKKGSIVIDGFDNTESRRLVTDHCLKNNIDCLHVGLYQDMAEVCWNPAYRVPEPVKGMDVCEYPLARNIIMMAVAVATECVIRFLETGVQEDYLITLKDFKILPR